jgi:hypothetical protein
MKASVAAHGIEIDVDPSKADIIQGEPIELTYRVTNKSADPMWLVVGGDRFGGRSESYKLRATSPAGTEVPVKVLTMGAGGGAMGPVTIDPGKAYETHLIVPAWLDLRDVGTYHVSVLKDLNMGVGARPKGDEWQESSKKTPLATRVGVDVRVRPATAAAMGEVIEALGGLMAGANHDDAVHAGDLMGFIHDERTVPHHAKATQKDENWNLVFHSINALASYPTATSLAALVSLLGKNEMTRRSAVHAIKDHNTPEGMNVLWNLRRDADTEVRLTVVHALHKQSPPNVVEKLTEMSSDSAPIVKEEAKRYLAERAAKP